MLFREQMSALDGLGDAARSRTSAVVQPRKEKLNPPSGNLCEIVLSLLRNPAFCAATKDLREPDGHLRRDAALAVDQFGESGARHGGQVMSLTGSPRFISVL